MTLKAGQGILEMELNECGVVCVWWGDAWFHFW